MPAPAEPLSSVVERFGDLKLLVIGDAILDVWMSGRASRLCREAPVPVVTLDDRQELPGGAANAALNAASLGAQVTLLSVIGSDQAGTTLRERLVAAGVDLQRASRPAHPSHPAETTGGGRRPAPGPPG